MSDDREIDACERFDDLLARGDLIRAEVAARALSPDWLRAERLEALSRAAQHAGAGEASRRLTVDALAAARAGERSSVPQDSIDASSVVWEIAEDLALRGEVGAAREVAHSILDSSKRERALQFVAEIAAGGAGSFEALRARRSAGS